MGALCLVAACGSTQRGGIKIDDSIQAESQDSRVTLIVLHYTAADTDTSLKILSQHKVSSHYLVTNDARPKVYQLVDESRRAWHAGISQWYGRTDINAASIGIEIVNAGGSGTQWDTYSQAQTETVIKLVRDIQQRHNIKSYNIVGHSDIAPQRKVDPGPRFPWKQLADAGLGRWYDTERARDYERDFKTEGLPDIVWLQNRLARAGYDVPQSGRLDNETRNVVAAFQMHYRPTLYNGEPDAQTMAILKALP